MKVAQAVVECFARFGVKQVFGIPGDAINHLVHAIGSVDDIEFVHVAHEESGAFAASAQGKLGAPMGACMGTAGPGAIHLLNGLYDAKKDRSPVVAITGQVKRDQLGRNAHQEIDLHALFDGVACYNETVTDEESAVAIIEAACRAAIANHGVAHVSLPDDIASKTAGDDPTVGTNEVLFLSPVQPPERCIDAAVGAINNAKNPLILAGIGALPCRDGVMQLAEQIGAPVIKTLKAKHLCADEHPLTLGNIGLLGTVPAVLAMRSCDLLIMLGTDYPYPGFLSHDAKVIQIDHDYTSIGRRAKVDFPVHGDCTLSVNQILRRLNAPKTGTHLESHQKQMKLWHKLMDRVEQPSGDEIKPQAFCRMLGDLASDSAIFCCDTGSVTSYFAKSLRVRAGQEVTLSGNLASMAYSVPAGIGLQLSHPDRQVITLTGDGSANMLLGELATLKKYELPVKVFVMNNGRLHLIDFEENVEGIPRFATELQNPDFAAVAQAFGFKGLSVKDNDALGPTLREALAHDGPVVVDVHVNPTQMLYPPRITPEQAIGYTSAKIKELWEKLVD